MDATLKVCRLFDYDLVWEDFETNCTKEELAELIQRFDTMYADDYWDFDQLVDFVVSHGKVLRRLQTDFTLTLDEVALFGADQTPKRVANGG